MMTDRELTKAVKISVEGSLIVFDHVKDVPEDDDTLRLAEIKVAEMQAILDVDPKKNFDIIINLSKLTSVDSMPSKARKVYADFAKNKQLIKAAMVGGGIKLKTIINFIMRLSGRGTKYKIFDTLPAAKAWLKEK